MKVFPPVGNERVHVKIWADAVDEIASGQIHNLQALPFAYHHIAIMPDVHAGYGMPIGGVLATDGVVVPNAVGVDIGCGLRAMKTGIFADGPEDLTIDKLKDVMRKIREAVPVGFEHHKENQESALFTFAPNIPIIQQELEAARRQLGTLGGGNHFIEIQREDSGRIWVMIHSGSRNFGLKIAKHYNEQAQKQCKRWYSAIPEFKGEDGLAFLPIENSLAKEYIEAMNYALMFAKENRYKMIRRVEQIISTVMFGRPLFVAADEIDIHHNYAVWEHHFGKNVIVHRKGATSAKAGEIGIIPGSQGTASYIVRGLGNPDSFNSCSHGAGRRMGRNEARRKLVLVDEQKRLDDLGVLHAVRGQDDLDEAAGAYKNIEDVMAQQMDLVEVVTKLTPLGVIKG